MNDDKLSTKIIDLTLMHNYKNSKDYIDSLYSRIKSLERQKEILINNKPSGLFCKKKNIEYQNRLVEIDKKIEEYLNMIEKEILFMNKNN